MRLDPVLAEVIACPQCHGALQARDTAGAEGADNDVLVCAACALAYPVRDGIPVLLTGYAQPFDDAAIEPMDDAHRGGPPKE
jgi:uncharacterized protein